jgi:hypothetical protein
MLPEVCLRLPVELERVDAWLDDEAFFAPFRAHFDPLTGRPSLPMETYLRMMYLNVRYRLGHETLVPGGVRLDLVAAVLPHRHRRTSAAPDHVDEDHDTVRRGHGPRVERGGTAHHRAIGIARQPRSNVLTC